MAKASSLVYRQYQDTRNIVQAAWALLLRKVTYEMFAERVVLGHDVEEERLDVVVECFRTEEQLGQ